MAFRPLQQTILHNPPETYGDCQRTCIAMVMGLDVSDVPHFGDQNLYPPDASRKAEMEWLRERDYGYIQIPVFGEWGMDYIRGLVENVPVIISGRSPRGDWNHDIVLFKGEIYDPHPDNTGLAGPCIDKDKPDEPKWYWVRFVVPHSVQSIAA